MIQNTCEEEGTSKKIPERDSGIKEKGPSSPCGRTEVFCTRKF
jgi:hypothetical protein